MFNLKSNLLFAGLISATTLLTGMAFSSAAMANSDKDSSAWERHCPSHYHYDKHCHKCVKDSRDSDDRSSKDSSHDSSHDSSKGSSSHDSSRDSSQDSSSDSSHHSSHDSNHGSSHDTSHNSSSNSNHNW
jgi:hypothetical protein